MFHWQIFCYSGSLFIPAREPDTCQNPLMSWTFQIVAPLKRTAFAAKGPDLHLTPDCKEIGCYH